MASSLNAKISALADLRQALRLMQELGISTSNVANLDDAKRRLRVRASKQTGSTGRSSILPDANMVTNLITRDKVRKDRLLNLYSRVILFLKKLPESLMSDLRTAFPDLEKRLKAAETSLRNDKCAILIAGETSAGKSTLLNLLLGQTKQNLLPVSHLSVTSVICELKYGERPHAVAHPWPDDREARAVDISLSDQNADKVLSDYIHHKGDRDERFRFQKVEIFWPSEWLRAGVTIVDSPGVGENDEMTNLVKEYMGKAFGFIYVINSQNAGGIQPDRLQDLLLSSTGSLKKSSEEEWHLDPRSAIFVANKWELVKGQEEGEVKHMINTQLSDIWKGLSVQSQVFFLSAKEASQSMIDGVVNEDYGRLLTGIETLLPIGLNQRIEKHFSYASTVMRKATQILRMYHSHLEAKGVDREFLHDAAMERLLLIEARPQVIMNALHEKMKDEIKSAIEQTTEYLMTEDVVGRVCYWEDKQCPDSNNMDDLERLMEAYALRRIRQVINAWDLENDIFQGIQKRLMDSLKSNFFSLEAELNRIERMMTLDAELLLHDDGDDNDDEDTDDDETFTRAEKIIIGVSAPIWVPLGLVIGLFALPALGIKKALNARSNKKKLKEYRRYKGIEMEFVSKMLLEHILGSGQLEKLLEEKINGTTKLVQQMVDGIPNAIESDKQIITKLKEQEGQDSRLLNVLDDLRGEAFILQGEMDFMYMVELMSFDINMDELVGWKEGDKPVAQGNFAKVYKATLVRPGESNHIPCAVKALKDPDTQELCPLTESNASDARLEESNLRAFKHRHVVKYFGSALMTKGSDHYLLMVMEFCACSLDTYIANRDHYLPPSECSNDSKLQASLGHATDLAWQIADGILGIHAEGFVHRDLKPANILMTSDGQIRLADLGLSKSEKKITGTLAGTLLYMAPEVLGMGRYGQPADMFAYGLILWELWYGRNVSEVVYQLRNLRSLPSDAFKKERRPEASGPWCKTMTECWSEKPDDRPDVKECRQRFASDKY